MSFDLVVLSGVKPLEADQAAEIYRRLNAGEPWANLLQPDPNVAEFVREITSRWPQVDDVPPDQAASCLWSVEFNVSPAHVISAMQWPRVDDVAPAYIETALRHGLNVFDPQAEVLHSAGTGARAVSPRASAPRVCAGCGKPIEPTELTAEMPGREGIFHMGCLLADPHLGVGN